MEADGTKTDAGAHRQRLWKAIGRRLGRAWHASLMISAVVVAAAWFQSERGGLEHRWADPVGPKCGRIASLRGYLIWQSCDLTETFRRPGDPALGYPVVMPEDFQVGNTFGGPAKLPCGLFDVPFYVPDFGTFFKISTNVQSSASSMPPARWTAKVDENILAYWIIEAVIVFQFLVVIFQVVQRARAREESSTSPTWA